MTRQKFRNAALILFCFTSFFSYSQDSLRNRKPTEISITEAMDQGIVELKISGSYDPRIFYEVLDRDGVHFGKCMAILLVSKIDTPVFLRLDCGTQLIPFDTSVQTMIVTQKAIFPLYPNQEYITRFYAMCGQLHDAPPNIETAFKIGELADTGLVKLARYLDANFIQNMLGQHAMWAYTDQADFEELEKYGADSLSIAKTKEILNNLNLETKLTPPLVAEPIEETNEMTINRYYIYGGLGLLGILVITIIILVFTRKKNSDEIA